VVATCKLLILAGCSIVSQQNRASTIALRTSCGWCDLAADGFKVLVITCCCYDVECVCAGSSSRFYCRYYAEVSDFICFCVLPSSSVIPVNGTRCTGNVVILRAGGVVEQCFVCLFVYFVFCPFVCDYWLRPVRETWLVNSRGHIIHHGVLNNVSN